MEIGRRGGGGGRTGRGEGGGLFVCLRESAACGSRQNALIEFRRIVVATVEPTQDGVHAEWGE